MMTKQHMVLCFCVIISWMYWQYINREEKRNTLLKGRAVESQGGGWCKCAACGSNVQPHQTYPSR